MICQTLTGEGARRLSKAGGDQIICTMRHTPDERYAPSIAADLASWCSVPNKLEQCPGWRVYIKQRWGY